MIKNSILKKVIRFVTFRLAAVLPDKLYLSLLFYCSVGYWPKITNPRSFNEKIQWLKLYDRHEEYSMMVDKVSVKDYVESKIGKEFLIPTLGVWDRVEDINWDSLPDQFVIKSASDSGGVVVCKDKSTLCIEDAVAKLSRLGKRRYSKLNKEYPYDGVSHRFIAEKYLEDESGFELKDYKFFCFDGIVKFLFVATGRQKGDTRFDFFDCEFNHLPVINGHPNADVCPSMPINFQEMIRVAEVLSKGIPHVRVDLYNVNGKVYFGELTFFHWSGMVPFEPRKWDFIFGEYLNLPIISG